MSHMSDNDPGKVTALQVGRGVMWSYLTFVLGKIMVFVSTVILARVLLPEDFGLVGLASVLAGYLGTLHTFGVGEAFIQSKFESKEAANVTFFLSAASGIALFFLSLLLTPVVVGFFGEKQLSIIFPALSSTYILTGVTTIHDAILVKELRFQERLVPNLAQSLGKGLVSIGLALMGFGTWAIVWGILAGVLLRTIALFLINPWKPSLVWDNHVAWDIFGFGKFMLLQNVLGALEANVDYLIVGRRLGVKDLGLYTLAYRAPELSIISLPSVVADVAYPAYAKFQNDRSGLQRSVLKAVQLISWFALPAGVGLAMISPAFILTFYTAKWASAIPVMQLLSLYAMVYTLTYNFGDAYKAIGRPDILNKLSLSTIVLTIFALWLGSQYGIMGVAWAHLIRVIVLFVVQIAIVNKVLDIPLFQIVDSVFKPVLCVMFMALNIWGASLMMLGVSPGWLLFVEIIIGGVTYIITSYFLNRSSTVSILLLILKVIGRSSSKFETLMN